MTYPETLEFLYSSLPAYQRIGKAAYKANLDTTIALDNYYGHPHRNYRIIHIAGTNGKGSVSHLLASILQEAGLKTGLYTSPHLRDFRERIKVNGTPVTEDYVTRFVSSGRGVIEELKPSFFEMTVAMAFQYFADCNVDVAVVETGMGGRLDSTNIVNPVLTIITNIGMDHTQFLGDTPAKIAAEKAGIIKPGVPVVVGRSDSLTRPVFMGVADERGCRLTEATSVCRVERVSYRSEGEMVINARCMNGIELQNAIVPLAGDYQLENIATLLTSVSEIREVFNISLVNIRVGIEKVLENTGLEGRWQVLKTSPLVICDTAHNSDGLRTVMRQLQRIRRGRLHFVLGFVDDKKLDDIIPLFPRDAIYHITRSSVPRSLSEEKLAAIFREAKIPVSEVYTDVMAAYDRAVDNAGAYDIVYVGGSTFIVADLLSGLSS